MHNNLTSTPSRIFGGPMNGPPLTKGKRIKMFAGRLFSILNQCNCYCTVKCFLTGTFNFI